MSGQSNGQTGDISVRFQRTGEGSRASAPHQAIDCDSDAIVGFHRTLDGARLFDLELAPQSSDYLLRGVEHVGVLRAALTVFQIRRIVSDEQEGAARCHRPRRPGEDGCEFGLGNLEIEQRNQIEVLSLGLVAT